MRRSVPAAMYVMSLYWSSSDGWMGMQWVCVHVRIHVLAREREMVMAILGMGVWLSGSLGVDGVLFRLPVF